MYSKPKIKEEMDKSSLYRIEFPNQKREHTHLKCYFDGSDFLFKRPDAQFSEFDFNGRLRSFWINDSRHSLFKVEEIYPTERTIEIIYRENNQGTRILVPENEKISEAYQTIIDEYAFFNDLQNNVLNHGWYSVKEVAGLARDKEVEMPDFLEDVINEIANFDTYKKIFGIEKKVN
ncbi:hypothetical protein KY334_08320 [Candidatus Woesearchaeota archaeon]|nr:hypothetical protein [Candidatus Woesearchaeota archaeon]